MLDGQQFAGHRVARDVPWWHRVAAEARVQRNLPKRDMPTQHEEQDMKATALSTGFFNQLAQKRQFAACIADLAAAMATQAGEAATRPLSREQLERAFQANLVETGLVMDLVLEWAGEQRAQGLASDNDVFCT
jgi:hypothetical protein